MLLFTPGPTPVPESVRAAMAKETIHHRTPEFTEIFLDTRNRLKRLLKMQEALMIASTGTGAMEACVTNLCKKKALVINAGKFGERFKKICEAFGIDYLELRYDWDTPAEAADVVEALKKDPDIDAVFVQICESSGGLRHPVEEIAKAAKGVKEEITVVADGITAVGVEPIDTSNIDALITGSQKALMLPPGLSMIGLSDLAVDKIGKGRGFYLNMAAELKKQREGTTAYTAATTLIIGLNEVLSQIESMGIEQLYEDTKKRSEATREALKAIGLNIYPKSPAAAMSAVIDEDAEKIRKLLKTRYDVNLAGGQESLKGRLFRINHMGFIKPYEACWVVNAIELALADIGRITYRGKAAEVFSGRYFQD